MSGIPPYRLEFYKSVFDYLKHLTTLSTGSVILLAAFLEKLFVQPKWKLLIAIALGGFMLTIVASVVLHTIVVFELSSEDRSTTLDPKGHAIVSAFVTIWVSFIVAILALTIFAIRNLF